MSRASSAAMPAEPRRRTVPGPLAWVALAVVYLVWGSTFVAIRVAVRDTPPATFAGARYLLAGLILYPIAIRSGGTALRVADRPGVREWAGCAAVGVFLLTVGNGGVTLAERHLESGLAALIAATIPLWMTIFAAMWTRRLPSRRDFVGVLAGLIGVVVLAGGGSGGHLGSLVISLVAASGWGFGSVLAGHLALPRRTLLGACMQLLTGGTALLLIGAVRGEWGQLDLATVHSDTYLAFGWLVLPGSVLAFSAYGYALSHLPLGIVSTYAYVNPIVAVLLGVVLLGEQLSLHEIAGATLIVIAVGVTLSRRQRPKVRPGDARA